MRLLRILTFGEPPAPTFPLLCLRRRIGILRRAPEGALLLLSSARYPPSVLAVAKRRVIGINPSLEMLYTLIEEVK